MKSVDIMKSVDMESPVVNYNRFVEEPPKLYVLCGMIASGKSTYCKNAAKFGLLTLNDDSIVNMLHGDDYLLYSKDLKLIYKSTENHIISMALAMHRYIIIDRALNLSVQGRRRWIVLAKSFDVPVEAIQFKVETPEVHAERRAKSDTRGHDANYWLEVARHHYAGYVPPTVEEGFDTIHSLTFDEIKEGKVIC